MNKKLIIGLIILLVVVIIALSYTFYIKEKFGADIILTNEQGNLESMPVSSITDEINELKTKIAEIPSKYISKDKPLNIVASRNDKNEPNFYKTMITRKVNGDWLGVLDTGRGATDAIVPATHPPRVEQYYLLQE